MNFRISPSKTEWLKFVKAEVVNFVGKDVMVVSSGCHALFINLETGEESILRANDRKFGAGEGIGRFAGHRTLKYFAFAEKTLQPSILIMSYPDFTKIFSFKTNSSDYVTMIFSDHELFMALGGFPSYTMYVWKWRVGERLLSVDTNIIYGKQFLRGELFNRTLKVIREVVGGPHVRVNYSCPVLMAQCVFKTNILLLWEFAMCGRKCVMTKERITYRNPEWFNPFILATWTTDGGLFVLDDKAHLYMVAQDNKLDRVLTWEPEGDQLPFFSWYLNGFMIHGSNGELKHFTKSGEWINDWNVTTKYKFKYLRAGPGNDRLICISTNDDMLYLDNAARTMRLLRSDDGGITDFCMIYPMGDYVVSLAHGNKVTLWRVDTGKMMDRMQTVSKKILKMAANPYYPYVCSAYDSGLLQMHVCLDGRISLMAEFQLCRIPLHMVHFSEIGTLITVANMHIGQFFIIRGLPGGKFKILTSVTANSQIADYMLTGTEQCLRLFMIFVTSNKYIAGNGIWRYCIVKNVEPTLKKYELENPNRYYYRMYISSKQPLRDRLFYAAPLDCRNLHELESRRGDTHVRIVDRIKSNHLMKRIHYSWNVKHLISYAYDGLIMIKDNNLRTILDVVMPHHRKDGGVNMAYSDPRGQRIVSLGRDGVIVCTLLTDYKEDPQVVMKLEEMMANCREMLSATSIGFNPQGIFAGKSWLEYKELIKIEAERIKFEKERNKMVKDLTRIREEVTRLLEKNLSGPENEYLDLQEFNLYNARKEERVKTSKELCDRTMADMKRMISENERVAKLIKANFWDPIDTQTRNMWAIFGNFDVQSYCVLPPHVDQDERLQMVEESRKVEQMLSKDDLFAPWVCSSNKEIEEQLAKDPKIIAEENMASMSLDTLQYEDLPEEEQEQLREQYVKELENVTAFAGTTAHLYTETNKNHYSQFELQAYYQHIWEIIMGQNDQQNLRHFFNKEFEGVFQTKIREMGGIIEKNARLRYILSELNYFSEEKFNITIEDPEWKQDEDPERVIVVTKEEVGISPYISPSEQAVLDAKAAEAERLRLLLLADDFKDRALMKMMNGVLEIRWEDELRKDVPLPKCMVEKDPEEFNEEDLRAIRDYEEKVVFLKSERERYKVILANEYAKVGAQVREGVRKFNEKLQELLLLKLQVESAITHEILRANRLKKWDMKRIDVDNEEEAMNCAIAENEQKAETLRKIVTTLNSFITEIRNNLDMFQNKDRFIDKSFRKEFQDASGTQIELLSKLYKKRPKVNLRVITSSCILNELSNCVLANRKSLLLNADASEFLKLLEGMDKFVGMPQVIDARMYAMLCRQRRIKIDNELRIRALQLDLAEAENTSVLHHKAVARCKDHMQTLWLKLEEIRNQKIQSSMNMELQIVLREGYVEIPRTGDLSDFTDAVMISRKVIEDINKVIIATGAKKIKAMKNAMNFKNEILMMEWEHRRRKMEISDLKSYLVDVGSVNVSKEIQSYLKARARGDNTDKGYSIEEEVELMTSMFLKMIEEKKQKVQRIQDKLDSLKREDKKAQKQIAIINVDVNEFRMNINEKLLKDNEKIIRLRMAAHMKRSKLITQIQSNQQEIFVLQTELELLRLRTVPVLEYRVDV